VLLFFLREIRGTERRDFPRKRVKSNYFQATLRPLTLPSSSLCGINLISQRRHEASTRQQTYYAVWFIADAITAMSIAKQTLPPLPREHVMNEIAYKIPPITKGPPPATCPRPLRLPCNYPRAGVRGLAAALTIMHNVILIMASGRARARARGDPKVRALAEEATLLRPAGSSPKWIRNALWLVLKRDNSHLSIVPTTIGDTARIVRNLDGTISGRGLMGEEGRVRVVSISPAEK